MTGDGTGRDTALEQVQEWLDDSGLEWEQAVPGTFVVTLPGEQCPSATSVPRAGPSRIGAGSRCP